MSSQLVKSSFGKDTKINNKQIVVVDGLEKTDVKCVMHRLSPTLPKSPSRAVAMLRLAFSFFKDFVSVVMPKNTTTTC